jgi:hypothetical protein
MWCGELCELRLRKLVDDAATKLTVTGIVVRAAIDYRDAGRPTFSKIRRAEVRNPSLIDAFFHIQ